MVILRHRYLCAGLYVIVSISSRTNAFICQFKQVYNGQLWIEQHNHQPAKKTTSHLKWSNFFVFDGEEEKDDVDDVMTTYDLSSPREWLEYWEVQHKQQGPYTVLRCDYDLSTKEWNIWGKEFHFQRLKDSLMTLLMEEKTTQQQKRVVDVETSSSSSSRDISKICSTEVIVYRRRGPASSLV